MDVQQQLSQFSKRGQSCFHEYFPTSCFPGASLNCSLCLVLGCLSIFCCVSSFVLLNIYSIDCVSYCLLCFKIPSRKVHYKLAQGINAVMHGMVHITYLHYKDVKNKIKMKWGNWLDLWWDTMCEETAPFLMDSSKVLIRRLCQSVRKAVTWAGRQRRKYHSYHKRFQK